VSLTFEEIMSSLQFYDLMVSYIGIQCGMTNRELWREIQMDYAVVLYMNEEKTAMVKEWIKELAVYDLK